MARPRRIEKVNELLKEVIARVIAEKMSFPEEALVTVTNVSANQDMRAAAVQVSVFSKNKHDESAVMAVLDRAAGFIQQELNRALRMRPVPKIHFRIDRGEKQRERVEELLVDISPETKS